MAAAGGGVKPGVMGQTGEYPGLDRLGCHDEFTFDIEIGKRVLDEMLVEAGVTIRYYAHAFDVRRTRDVVEGVYFVDKSGLQYVPARTVIDCTGDADIVDCAGFGTYKGDRKTGEMTIAIKHFYFDLMEGIQMPFFIYNFPAFSGFSLTPELLDELCTCPYVQGVKFTASDFFQLERMKHAHPELTVWNGYDEMLLSGLSAGASGGIGSTYNILCPTIRGIYDSFRAGNSAKALEYQHVANDMITALCKYGVFGPVKSILAYEGMDFGGCRKPFQSVSEEAKAELIAAYESFKTKLQAVAK